MRSIGVLFLLKIDEQAAMVLLNHNFVLSITTFARVLEFLLFSRWVRTTRLQSERRSWNWLTFRLAAARLAAAQVSPVYRRSFKTYSLNTVGLHREALISFQVPNNANSSIMFEVLWNLNTICNLLCYEYTLLYRYSTYRFRIIYSYSMFSVLLISVVGPNELETVRAVTLYLSPYLNSD